MNEEINAGRKWPKKIYSYKTLLEECDILFRYASLFLTCSLSRPSSNAISHTWGKKEKKTILQETFTRVISKNFHGLFETSCRYTNRDKCNLCATLSERFPIGCWINLSGRSIFKLALSPEQKRGHINCPHNSGRGVIISSRKVSRNCR